LDTTKYKYYYVKDSGTVSFSHVCWVYDNVSTVNKFISNKFSSTESGNLEKKTSENSMGISYVNLYKGLEIETGDEIFLSKFQGILHLDALTYTYDYDTLANNNEEF
jgi:hypothetical protein